MNHLQFLKKIIDRLFWIGLYELILGYAPYRNRLAVTLGLSLFLVGLYLYIGFLSPSIDCEVSISIDNQTDSWHDGCQTGESEGNPAVESEDYLKITVRYPDRISHGGEETLKLRLDYAETITRPNIFITLGTDDIIMDIGNKSLENSSVFTKEVPSWTPTATTVTPTVITTSPPAATPTPSSTATPTPSSTLTPTPSPTLTPSPSPTAPSTSVCPFLIATLLPCRATIRLLPVETPTPSPILSSSSFTVTLALSQTVTPTSVLSATRKHPKSWSNIPLKYGQPCYPFIRSFPFIRRCPPRTSTIWLEAIIEYPGQEPLPPKKHNIEIDVVSDPVEVLSLAGIAAGVILNILNFWRQIQSFLINNIIRGPEARSSNDGEN